MKLPHLTHQTQTPTALMKRVGYRPPLAMTKFTFTQPHDIRLYQNLVKFRVHISLALASRQFVPARRRDGWDGTGFFSNVGLREGDLRLGSCLVWLMKLFLG